MWRLESVVCLGMNMVWCIQYVRTNTFKLEPTPPQRVSVPSTSLFKNSNLYSDPFQNHPPASQSYNPSTFHPLYQHFSNLNISILFK